MLMNINSPIANHVTTILRHQMDHEYNQKYQKVYEQMRQRFFNERAFREYVTQRLGPKPSSVDVNKPQESRIWKESVEDE